MRKTVKIMTRKFARQYHFSGDKRKKKVTQSQCMMTQNPHHYGGRINFSRENHYATKKESINLIFVFNI